MIFGAGSPSAVHTRLIPSESMVALKIAGGRHCNNINIWTLQFKPSIEQYSKTRSLQDITETILGGKNSVKGPLLLKLLFFLP